MMSRLKIFIALICLFLVLSGELYSKDNKVVVAVVADSATYCAISADIDSFVASMDESGKHGVLIIDHWSHPDSLRAELRKLYKSSMLEGAILIGDIPIPMIRDAHHLTTAFKMNPKRDWKKSSVPSDRFYDDFDLEFEYLKQDEDKPLYHYYSLKASSPQTIQCDIYTSRIKPPMVPGVGKYEAIAQYLKKAVAQKQIKHLMSNILYFAGHGYNSESYNARIDEAGALKEQFMFLGKQRGTDLNFINFDFDKFVKGRVQKALADPVTDLAIMHHHGSTDAQLLSAIPATSLTSEWLDNAKRFFRGKITSAKDTAAAKKKYMENYGVPESFMADAFARAEEDSLYYASMDINIPDMYGYTSNANVVILDACFNGAFCEDDYLAGYYIFNPGQTMVVKANSVNTLQDTWTNELMGLMDAGVCFGNWAKGQLTLESHLFGDASYSFENRYPKYNIDNTIVTKRGDNKYWRKLLNCGVTDVQALALKTLSENNGISSEEILEIERNNPSGVMRLEAFMSLKRRADHTLTEALRLGMEDSYELLQRLSSLTAAENGDPALKELVAEIVDNPTTSTRVRFHLNGAKEIFLPTELSSKEIEELLSPETPLKEKQFIVSAQRNECSPALAMPMIEVLKQTDNQEFRLAIVETLGWYRYSYKRDEIVNQLKELLPQERNESVANEIIKSIARLCK